jgi:hypothetical protein
MTYSSSEPLEAETLPGAGADLLRPLTEAQQWVVDIIGDAFWKERFTWPTFLYVEAEMDNRGHDLREVLATFPWAGGGRNQYYGALSSPHTASISETHELKLSLLGFWHCDEPLRPFARDAVADVISILNMFVVARRSWRPDPTESKYPEITSEVVLAYQKQRVFDGNDADRNSARWSRLLYQLMEDEPCFRGGHSASDDTLTSWKWTVDRSVLQYKDVASIEQYVERMATLFAPLPVTEHRVTESPLDLPTSLGYLDSAWRLTHGRRHLLNLVSPEKVASLAFNAGSREEFFDRLSALCDTMKGFQVPAGSTKTGHPLVRMKGHLQDLLPNEAQSRVAEAVDVLSNLVAIRNGGEHGDAQDKAASSWLALGVHLPVTDWAAAWTLTRQRTIVAFDVLRDELISESEKDELIIESDE